MQSPEGLSPPPRPPAKFSRIPSLFTSSTSKLPSPLSQSSNASPVRSHNSAESIQGFAVEPPPQQVTVSTPNLVLRAETFGSDCGSERTAAASSTPPEFSFPPPGSPTSSPAVVTHGDSLALESLRVKNGITVSVRFRPLSDRERQRGDREVWGIDNKTNVGLINNNTVVAKYAYDIVFPPIASNKSVFEAIAKPLVSPAMNGINGTVFAYGVTSSGKTFTMMGTQSDPGLVQRTIREIFVYIERHPSKVFLIRLSVLEIYNEVIHDLLEPSRTNLKIREDLHRGVSVEGLAEEVVVSSDHALALIAAGDAHRKVSATAYNEDSSRSHTICRLSVESSDRSSHEQGNSRTLAFFNLIDLAGSESARATVSKGQRMEGSFINKSLLTLGTVIHKLADGNAVHVPFRDSKLTRLLQNSLSGTGAKVAVVCNITPAGAQAEETHNTLKFATRAKMVKIAVSKNEIVDDKSLIRRYQREVQELKQQLARITAGSLHAPSLDTDVKGQDQSEEVVSLRNKLEAERQARMKQEQERVTLEARMRGLMRLVLHSSQQENAKRVGSYSSLKIKRSASCESLPSRDNTQLEDYSAGSGALRHQNFSNRGVNSDSCQSISSLCSDNEQPLHSGKPSWLKASSYSTSASNQFDRKNSGSQPSASPITSVQSNGDLNGACDEDQYDEEALREQIRLLSEELQDKELDADKHNRSSVVSSSVCTSEKDVELQVLYADREVLQDQLMISESTNERLRQDIAEIRQDMQQLRLANEQMSALNMQYRFEMGALRKNEDIPGGPSLPHAVPGNAPRPQASTAPADYVVAPEGVFNVKSFNDLSASLQAHSDGDKDPELWGRLQMLEEQVAIALQEVARKDQVIAEERQALLRIRELEASVEQQYETVSVENHNLREEIKRLELANTRLQGYMLDTMTPEELSNLICSLTQAVERVRVTVQVRRMSTASANLRQ